MSCRRASAFSGSVLDHVVANGDAAETSYLEAKSTVDITSKPGLVKVAKFLLGCANRLPEDAARHFKGYAVLVIGAQQGKAAGVALGADPHEFAGRLRPYLSVRRWAYKEDCIRPCLSARIS